MDYYEKPISEKLIHKGGIVSFVDAVVELPNGKQTHRDIIKHPGASVVVPITDDGKIYMVRQYRAPACKDMLEIPAGKLDGPDEDPLDCAARELSEETGLSGDLKYITSFYSTPGFSNEILHLYLATNLQKGESHADEDEFLSCELYSVDELIEMIYNHTIVDSKTIIGILLAERELRRK